MKFFANKKKRFIFIGAIILLVLALTVIVVISLITKNGVLKQGFSISHGCEDMNPVCCAYQSDQKIFDMNDVTLDFYYGAIRGSISGYKDRRVFTTVYFQHKGQDRKVIKILEENIFSEKYNIYETNRLLANILDLEYNYSEKITIPKELFINETGIITFNIYAEVFNENGVSGASYGASQPIYYKVTGNKVELSTKEFK